MRTLSDELKAAQKAVSLNTLCKVEFTDEFRITAFASGGVGLTTASANAHGMSNGDIVIITGNTTYNGRYAVSAVAANTFKFGCTYVATGTGVGSTRSQTFVGTKVGATAARILEVDGTEEPCHQQATIILNNSDKSLTDDDFSDYKVVISYGLHTTIARSAWVATTLYANNAIVRPTTVNGYQYICIRAGVSDGTEPTWPTTIGATVSDGTVIWKMHGNSSDEYSACAPLWVKDTAYTTKQNTLDCHVFCQGLPDIMSRQTASADYTEESDDTKPIDIWIAQICKAEDYLTEVRTSTATGTTANKLVDSAASFVANDVGKVIYNSTDHTWAIIINVDSASTVSLSANIMVINDRYYIKCGGPGAIFADYADVNIDWDSSIGSTNLVKTLIPADTFVIYKGENRMSVIRRLLEPTDVRIRCEADGHMTLFVPTTSGVTYDAEFALSAGSHKFYQKYHKQRIVVPNHIDVLSWDDPAALPSTGAVKTETAAGVTVLPLKNLTNSHTVKQGSIATVTSGGKTYSYEVMDYSASISGGETTIQIKPISQEVDTNLNTAEILDAIETDVDLSATGATAIPAGSIIKIESEYMWVSATGTTLTVTRPFLGSTAATHATGLDVYIITVRENSVGLVVLAAVDDVVKVYEGHYNYAEVTGLALADRIDMVYTLPLTSDTQASTVADAILLGFTTHNPKDNFVALQHAGLEVYDYITVDDDWEVRTGVVGNIGRIRRHYTPKQSLITISLGNDNMMTYRNILDVSMAKTPPPPEEPAWVKEDQESRRSLIEQIKGLLKPPEPEPEPEPEAESEPKESNWKPQPGYED